MRRGLKRLRSGKVRESHQAARAAPYEKGTETAFLVIGRESSGKAARAAPYEKGTETRKCVVLRPSRSMWPRARPPMRRGLKPHNEQEGITTLCNAARAAPY